MSLEKELRKRGFVPLDGVSYFMDYYRTVKYDNRKYYIVIYREQFKSYFRITLDNFGFGNKKELKRETIIETGRKFFGLYRPKKKKEILEIVDKYILQIEEFENEFT